MIRVVRGFAYILAGKVGRLVVTVVATPILVRLLGSGGYGDYALAITVFAFAKVFLDSGAFNGVRKYVAEDRSFPRWEEAVLGTYLRAATALVAGLVAILWASNLTGFTTAFLPARFETFFYLLSALVVVHQVYMLVRSALMGLSLERYSELLVVANEALFAVVGIGLVVAGYGVAGVLAGRIVGTLLPTIVGGVLLARRLSMTDVFDSRPAGFPTGDLLDFNRGNILFVFLLHSLYYVDVIVLYLLVGDQAAGYYKAVLVLAQFTWFVPAAVQNAVLHGSSEMWHAGDDEQVTRLLRVVTKNSFLASAFVAVVLATAAEPIIGLYYGEEYLSALAAFVVLLPGTVGFAVARPIYGVIQGKGDMRVLIYATGVAAVANVVLNVALIPEYGLIGAAVATSLSYSSMFVLHVLGARRVGLVPIRTPKAVRIVAAALITGTAVEFLVPAHYRPITTLFVVGTACVIIYVVTGVAVRAFEADDVRVVAGAIDALR